MHPTKLSKTPGELETPASFSETTVELAQFEEVKKAAAPSFFASFVKRVGDGIIAASCA
jgi:hypothetical protein